MLQSAVAERGASKAPFMRGGHTLADLIATLAKHNWTANVLGVGTVHSIKALMMKHAPLATLPAPYSKTRTFDDQLGFPTFSNNKSMPIASSNVVR